MRVDVKAKGRGVTTTGFKGFVDAALKAVGRTELKFNEYYQDLARETLRTLAENSPQYSGYFAANWRIRTRQASGRISSAFDDYSTLATRDQFKPNLANRRDGKNFWSQPQDYRGNLGALDPKKIGDREAIDWTMAMNEKFIDRITVRAYEIEFYNDVRYAEYVAYNRSETGRPFLRPMHAVLPQPIPIAAARQFLSTVVG